MLQQPSAAHQASCPACDGALMQRAAAFQPREGGEGQGGGITQLPRHPVARALADASAAAQQENASIEVDEDEREEEHTDQLRKRSAERTSTYQAHRQSRPTARSVNHASSCRPPRHGWQELLLVSGN